MKLVVCPDIYDDDGCDSDYKTWMTNNETVYIDNNQSGAVVIVVVGAGATSSCMDMYSYEMVYEFLFIHNDV